MRSKIAIYGLAVALLAATGCRSLRQTAHSVDNKAVETTAPVYKKARFTYRLNDGEIVGQVRIQEDSVVWASAVKLIELGRARLTPDSVVVYVRMMGRYFRGSYEDVYRRTGVKTSFAEVHAAITSEHPSEGIGQLMERFKMPGTVTLTNWETVDSLAFPIAKPPQATDI